MNYHNKKFKTIETSSNSEASADTVFHYKQEGNIVFAVYSNATIIKGQLMGIVDKNGNINMRYHHINTNGEMKTGKCISIPEKLKNGKIRLHEKWEWTCDDFSTGNSILDEL